MATDVRNRRDDLARILDEWTPAWERAQVFPVRYPCTEDEYLSLDSQRLVEYADGFLEILPMPATQHQLILAFLFKALDARVMAGRLGRVLFAPLKVRTGEGKVREPDILFMKREHARRVRSHLWEQPDLVMEIVSENNRRHDLETKRDEYARAGIPEHWIVDPEEATITVFVLKRRRRAYAEPGVFHKGERAASTVVPGFGVDVTEVFSQEAF